MILKTLYCIPVALAYQVATNPFVLAFLLVLPYGLDAIPWLPWTTLWSGHGQFAAWWLGVYLLLCAASIAFGVHRKSRFEPYLPIFTAPDWLFLFGNEQEGQDPFWYQMKHPKWPKWLRAFVFCAWRNKFRNLPFVRGLQWLHVPHGTLAVHEAQVGPVLLRLRTRGWMAEFEYVCGRRFGDFGPRLDQPDAWGGVSWAFRPWGKF